MKVNIFEITDTRTGYSHGYFGKKIPKDRQFDHFKSIQYGECYGKYVDNGKVFIGISIDDFKKGEINFCYVRLFYTGKLPVIWNELDLLPENILEDLLKHMKRHYKKYICPVHHTVDFIKWGLYD